MQNERLFLSSKTVDISEADTYLELTNRLCFYNEPNFNDVMLPYDETSEEKAKTLVNMPVVAKYTQNASGQPTFKGHEAYLDENGEIQFGTDSIGTHTEIYIEEDSVDVHGETKILPCLFAKYRIWKRKKNVVLAVRRLYEEDKLFSSWEIQTLSYIFKDGVKSLIDYSFLGNCLLGYENSSPAYGDSAKAINMSSAEQFLMVAEALSKDIILNKEEEILKKNETSVASDTENTDQATLTDFDLKKALRLAVSDKLKKDKWDIDIICHMPIEKTLWVKTWQDESELDVMVFTYEVENDVVTVSEPVASKLITSVSQINSTIAEMQKKISEQNDALIHSSSTIQALNTQISDLSPFKEKFESVEQERIEKELSERRDALKSYAIKSGHISVTEIENSEENGGSVEIKSYIETLNESAIKDIIADRFMASLEQEKNKEIQTSTVDAAQAKANITDDDVIDHRTFIKNFIGGKK